MNIIYDYEQVLIGNIPKIPALDFTYEDTGNERLALSVFRYAIEMLLKWNPTDAMKLFTPAIEDQMKLTPILRYIEFPSEFIYPAKPGEKPQGMFTSGRKYLLPGHTEYIVYRLYRERGIKYDFRKYVIGTYKKVLAGEMKYPKDYMYGNKGLIRARLCLQYAIQENKLFHSSDEMYRFFATGNGMEFLKQNKLTQLYRSFYTSPIDYLHYSLPAAYRSNLFYNFYRFCYAYKKKYRRFPPGVTIPDEKKP